MWTAGSARAARASQSAMWPHSVATVFRNLRRAGTLAKRSATSTRVPCGPPAARVSSRRPSRTRISQPSAAPAARVRRRSVETEAMAGSASPRNP
jgi:hypothetical protein